MAKVNPKTGRQNYREADSLTKLRSMTEFQRGEVLRWMAVVAEWDCDTLHIYEPLPRQKEFHDSWASERINRGSNRSGKTESGMWELAAVVRGEHPLSGKHPAYPLRGGRAACVGIDEGHLGRVFFNKLLKEGGFMRGVIRDPQTGKWRPYKHWQQYDADHPELKKPAPPLIPARCLKGKMAWKKRAQEVVYKFTTTNDWEVYFYAGGARPPRGDSYHIVVFDEEVPDNKWYAEMVMRRVDVGGRFWWLCTPDVGGDDLIHLHERAEELRGSEHPEVEEFYFNINDNPYVSQEDKDKLREQFKNDPEEYRIRVLGEYASLGHLVYPEFAPSVHEYPRTSLPDGQVPKTWTRYMSTDPGRTRLGVVFCAIPPPSWRDGNFILIYDELLITKADANKYGIAVEEKTRFQNFEKFLIDQHGGQLGDIGSGMEVMAQYAAALRIQGVWDRVNMRTFLPITATRNLGIESVRQWLLLREDGKPTLRVLEGTCPELRYELMHWKNKKNKSTGKWEAAKTGCDLIDPVKYLALFNPTYVTPKEIERDVPTHVRDGLAWRDRMFAPRDKHFIFGPTSRAS